MSDRRALALEKFAEKCITGKYSHWLPLNDQSRRNRKTKIYKEDYARTDRLRKTPIFTIRRIMNEKHAISAK